MTSSLKLSGLMVAVGTVGYLVDVVFLLFYMSIVRRVEKQYPSDIQSDLSGRKLP